VTDYLNSFGYIGIMAFSFLAATIVPVSSEAALASALALDMQPLPVLLFATFGNCAGVAFNYWLGYKGEEKLLHKHLQKRGVAKAYKVTQRWGKWSLLISWLPVIGDPITILAGVLRVNFGFFVTIAFPLRFLRYLFLILILKVPMN
jgi:membrane protein YqaA with SNARE-associated domain